MVKWEAEKYATVGRQYVLGSHTSFCFRQSQATAKVIILQQFRVQQVLLNTKFLLKNGGGDCFKFCSHLRHSKLGMGKEER